MAYLFVRVLLFGLISYIGTRQDQGAADELANSRAIEVLRDRHGIFERDEAGRIYWVILDGDEVTTDVIRVVSRCRSIKILTLGSRMKGKIDLRTLSRLTLLRSLSIKGASVRDVDLSFLRDLKHLKTLDFSYTAITGEAGLATLAQCRRIDPVAAMPIPGPPRRFPRQGHVSAGCGFLGYRSRGNRPTGLKNAENLGFANLDNTAADDEVLKGLPSQSLSYLYLKGTPISDRGVKSLARCRNLEGLHLSGTRVGDEGVRHLGGLEKLKSLDLRSTKVGNAGMQALGTNLALVELRLGNTRVSDEGLKQLKSLVALKELDLSGTGITDAGMSSLKTMSKLLSLDTTGTHSGGPPTVDALGCFSSLQILRASGTNIDDHGLGTIAGLKELSILDLSKTAIGDAGVKRLAGHESLENLYLTNTTVGNSGVQAILQCPRLKYLGLGNTQITDDAMIQFGRHYLVYLDVSGTKITSPGILALIDRPKPGIYAIDITNMNITLPGKFKPPVREGDRTIIRAPFDVDVENQESPKERRRIGKLKAPSGSARGHVQDLS